MLIVIGKTTSKAIEIFNKAEWQIVDQKHFGKQITWNTKVYWLKAEEMAKEYNAHKIFLITG